MTAKTAETYYVPVHHYGPCDREYERATWDEAADVCVSTYWDTIELRRRDHLGDRMLRRWDWNQADNRWQEVAVVKRDDGRYWQNLDGQRIVIAAECPECGAVSLTDGEYMSVYEHMLGCPRLGDPRGLSKYARAAAAIRAHEDER